MISPCPFCHMDQNRIFYQDDFCYIVRDAFPVSPGHTLLIPKRHVASFFDLTEEERIALLMVLDKARRMLDHEFKPDSWNIGINDGPAAGQTVPHCHAHLIPRYHGDCEDPRGGVRWIMPDKAVYWNE